jgi:hypothetical protein
MIRSQRGLDRDLILQLYVLAKGTNDDFQRHANRAH